MARVEKVISVVTDSGTRVTLSPSDLFVIKFMLNVYNYGNLTEYPVHASQYVRLQNPSLSLRDSKDVVDALRNEPSVFN